MAGKYISNFTGAQIDEALMKALMYNPDENGWIKLPSTIDEPISLNELTSIGNFVIDYIEDGPFIIDNGVKKEIFKDIHPINISIVTIDDVLTQYIFIMDDVYYREMDNSTGLYPEQWLSKKTTNFIYVNDYPENPELNAIVIVPDEKSSLSDPRYTMRIWNGVRYIDVYPNGIMQKPIYDPQGRETDFFKYVDETMQLMNMGSIGIHWIDKDITSQISTPISAVQFLNSGAYIGFENSSKVLGFSFLTKETSITDLPMICQKPQFFFLNDQDSVNLFIYDKESMLLFQKEIKDTDTSWVKVEVPDADTYGLVKFIGTTNYVYHPYDEFGDGIDIVAVLAVDNNDQIYKIAVTENNVNTIATGSTWDGIDFFTGLNDEERYPFYNPISNNGYMVYNKSIDVEAWIATDTNGTVLHIKDDTYDRTFDIDTNEVFTAISNLVNIFGDYAGYLVTKSGVVYMIQTIDEDIFLNRVYQSDFVIDWRWAAYSINALSLFGSSYDVPTNHILLTTQDDGLLNMVEEHISNGHIHFSDTDRRTLNTRETKENVDVKMNQVQVHIENYVNDKVASLQATFDKLQTDSDNLTTKIDDHIADTEIHPSQAKQQYWSSKAEAIHTHNLDGNVKINANQIVDGIIPLDRIPSGAKEIVTKVNFINDMLNLTIDDVQNGDRVAVHNSGLYEVVDETKLAVKDASGTIVTPADPDAFMECGAGTDAFIYWKNVQQTPDTLAGYGITDSYTKQEAEAVFTMYMQQIQDKMEDRYSTFDVAEMYSLALQTNENIQFILQEINNALAISQQVKHQDDDLDELHKRMVLISEKLEDCEAISRELLNLYS